MNTSNKTYDPITDIIFSKGLKINSAVLKERKLHIILNTKLVLVVSLKNYERLHNATLKELSNFKIIASGTGLHWPSLDEDLSLYGFLKEYFNQNIQNKRKLVIA
jgi:hypothetical protein